MCRTGLSKLLSYVSAMSTIMVKWLMPTPSTLPAPHVRMHEDRTRARRGPGYLGRKAAAARRARRAAAAARKDARATSSSSILGRAKAAWNKMLSRASDLPRSAWEKIKSVVRSEIYLAFTSSSQKVPVEVYPWTRLESIEKKSRCWYGGEELDKTRALFSLGIVPGSTITCLGRHGPRTSPSSASLSSPPDKMDADEMMQILIEEEEAETMHRVLLEKEILAKERQEDAKKRRRLKASRKAALKRAARSSTTTFSRHRYAQEIVENLHPHATPRSETMAEGRQVEWAGNNDPFDIFLKLFDGTTKTLRNVRCECHTCKALCASDSRVLHVCALSRSSSPHGVCQALCAPR